MCQIDFDIATFDADGDTVTAAEGRYRLQGAIPWTTFVPTLGAAQTPDILVSGTYELQVRVQANSVWSDWFPSVLFYIQDCPSGNSPVIENITVSQITDGVSYNIRINGSSNQNVRYQLVTETYDATATVSPASSFTLIPSITQTGNVTLDPNGLLTIDVTFAATTCGNQTEGTFTLFNDDNLTLSAQVLTFSVLKTC